MGRRHKCARPVVDATMAERWAQSHIAWQILVLGAQPVGDPTTHAGPDKSVRTRVQLQQRSAMAGIGAMHGVEHAQLVGLTGDVREQFTGPKAALPVLAELPGRGQQVVGGAGDDTRLGEWQRLAIIAAEQRLVVEGVDMAGAAMHEQKDHPLGARSKVGLAWSQRAGGRPPGLWFQAQQTLQGQGTKAGAGSLEQLSTAGHGITLGFFSPHGQTR